jgi:DNA topoisomerase IB
MGPSKTIVIERNAMRMVGPLAFVGTLTLTRQTLRFKATGKLDRLIGVDDVDLALSSIGRVHIRPDNKTVTLWVGDKMHRFAGRGALPVAERLEEQLARMQDALSSTLKDWSEEINFDPNIERLGCSGRATLKKPNYGRGWLLLTSMRLLFLPDKKPRRLPSFVTVDIAILASLAESTKPKKTIDVRNGKENYKFIPAEGLGFAKKFWSYCQNVDLLNKAHQESQQGLAEEKGEVSADTHVLIQRSVMRAHGPLAFVGTLLLTKKTLEFKVQSKLDRLVGVEDNKIPLRKIHRVRDVPSKKMVTVFDETGTSRYTGPGAIAIADRIHTLLSTQALTAARDPEQVKSAEMISGALPRGSPLSAVLKSWNEEVQINFEDENIIAASESLFQRDHETSTGWLFITQTRMYYLPLGGPDVDQNRIEIPVSDVRAREDKPITSFSIDLAYKQKHFHFVPRAGQRFVDAFWDHCVSIAPIANQKRRQLSIRARITGRPHSLCFLQDGDVLFYTNQTLTMFLKKGLGILLAETPTFPLPKGMPVCVEICQPEGVYSFDTVVLRTGTSPKGVRLKEAEACYLILVRMPRQTRCYNRRTDFRMALRNYSAGILSPTVEFTRLTQTDEDDYVSCTVQNLSAGGCMIRTLAKYKAGDIIRLALPVLGLDLSIQAEVIRVEYVSPTAESDGGYDLALMFPGISKPYGDRIHRFIADMQVIYIRKKRDIADGYEDEEEEETDSSIQPVINREEPES